VALLAVLAVGTVVQAQDKPKAQRPAPEWPDTGVGRAARAFYEAINADDEDAVRRFLDERLAEKLVQGGGGLGDRGGYAAMMGKLRAQSGGLAPIQFRGDGADGVLGVMSRAKGVDRLIGVEFFASPDEPGKVRQIELHPMTPPGPPAAWPEGSLDDAAIARAIDRRLQEVADADRFSGVVLVARGDRILVHRGVGQADRERGIANTPETRFGTASVGKMFTAVAIAQLVERGTLRFDMPLSEALPEYPDREVAGRITLHHLLTHTSGLGDPFLSGRREPGRRYETPWENIGLFAGDPPAFEPGS
jgi:hypothetical protein